VHLLSTWPRSREAVERNFRGFNDAVKWKIVRDNVARMYDIALP